jgi:Ca2+:H+ antiporter
MRVGFADIFFSTPKVSVVALTRGEIRIVQASMLGSILSNILLVWSNLFSFAGAHSIDNYTLRSSECVSSLVG